ncbi:TetR/AcrR family transcriptional regulator [Nitrospirillum sp. BR 11828]|uniref:TetR/AcrR family transcriptional regulator n=1 Tax=Nitrospirillum sp. BR 11828 TaxID=3104325 RepID=UPI002ACAA6B3|nr:TetR/AcrR family transcriptional regulator [Nitrospirillum sp. BR 11828]MDZ5650581.1 TetR/AcrR family transcriptional regulator [Nitrospirillum sp. BR 11828]
MTAPEPASAASTPGPALTGRAAATRQRLMQAGAELLGEVGIERISTNQVASRAGVTPPVFYRHFKDKYDLLAALGGALMESQNDILYDWLERSAPAGFEELMQNHYQFLLSTIQATSAVPGAVWIMRALRAVPSLTAIRLASHEMVTDRICRAMGPLLPEMDPAELRLRTRIAVDAGYAAVEMALDDPTMSPESVCRALTDMWMGGLRHGV